MIKNPSVSDENRPYNMTIFTSCSYNKKTKEIQKNCKIYRRDHNGEIRVAPYDLMVDYNVTTKRVVDPQTLRDVLKVLNRDNLSAPIMGELIDGSLSATNIPKLYRDNEDGRKATVRHRDSAWIVLDFDDVILPFDVDPSNKKDVLNALCWVLKGYKLDDVKSTNILSGTCFWDKDNGVLNPRKISFKTFIMFDNPICQESAEEFIGSLKTSIPIPPVFKKGKVIQRKSHLDKSSVHPSQLTYTADPIFLDGLKDHLSIRFYYHNGQHDYIKTSEYEKFLYDSTERDLRKKKKEEEEQKARKASKPKKASDETEDFLADVSSGKKSDQERDLEVRDLLNSLRGITSGNRNIPCYVIGGKIGNLLRGDKAEQDRIKDTAYDIIMERGGRDRNTHYTSFCNGFNKGLHGSFAQQEKKQKNNTNVFLGVGKEEEKKKWKQEYVPAIPSDQSGCFIFTDGCGSGKTKAINDHARDTGKSTLSVAPTRALTRNITQRQQSLGMNTDCYLTEDDKVPASIYFEESGTVCIDSLDKVEGSFDNLLVDEFDEVLTSALKDPKKFFQLYNALKYQSNAARNLYISSATMEETHYNILQRMCPNKEFKFHGGHIQEDPNLKVTFLKADKSKENVYLLIRKAIQRGLKIHAPFGSKNRLKDVRKRLLSEWPWLNILCLASGSTEEEREALSDPNKHWGKYDAVFTTTTAGSGVDFSLPGVFDLVIGDYSGINANMGFPYTSILQSVRRVRHTNLKEIYLFIPLIKKRPRKVIDLLREAKAKHNKTLEEVGISKHEVTFASDMSEVAKTYLELLALRDRNSCYHQDRMIQYYANRGIECVVDYDVQEEINKAIDARIEKTTDEYALKKLEEDRITDELIKSEEKASKKVRAEFKEEEQDLIVNAPDICAAEAEEIEKRDCTPEEFASVRRFKLKDFYGEEIPITKDLIKKDDQGKTRYRIARRARALQFDQLPQWDHKQDLFDLTYNYRPEVAENRSIYSKFLLQVLEMWVNRYPEINEFLPYKLEIKEDFDFLTEINRLRSDWAETDFLTWKQKEEGSDEKLFADLGKKLFGFERNAKVQYKKDENGKTLKDEKNNRVYDKTIYSLSLENEKELFALAANRYERARNELAERRLELGFETIGFDCNTVEEESDVDDFEEFQKLFEEETKVSQQKKESLQKESLQKEISQTESAFIDRFYN